MPIFELLLHKNEIIYTCDADCGKIELVDVGKMEDRFKQCSKCKIIRYCSQKVHSPLSLSLPFLSLPFLLSHPSPLTFLPTSLPPSSCSSSLSISQCQAANWKSHKTECRLMLGQDLQTLESNRMRGSDAAHIAEGGEVQSYPGGERIYTFPK
ncbi:hypothetical protein BDY24DRAFT_402454 [Mrakia frigida]|uniref:uncharacterized protein n=1 Tax=Mrakia frigida TaxID=29902 RepID=UPI003FCBF529